MLSLLYSLQSEWIKLRRSLVGWLILGAAFFVPLIVLASRLRRPDQLPALYRTAGFWEKLWTMNWEANSIMILPLTMILITSLVVQVEYRNNTWKQLHASPKRWITIYASKLIVVLILLFQLLALFNIGMLLCGALPALLFADVALPAARLPLLAFWDRSARYFVDTLPIVGLQYVLALRLRNFIAPLGIGMAVWILSVGMLSSSYSYFIPYSYAGMDYLVDANYKTFRNLPASVQDLAIGSFALFIVAGYGVYVARSDKG